MFALSSQPGMGFFLLVLSGEVGAAEICSANSFLIEMSRQMRVEAVLLDIMGATVNVGPQDAHRTRLHLAANVPPLRRLAIVHKPEDDHGLVRQAFESAGVEVAQFNSLLDAEKWIAQAVQQGSGATQCCYV